MSDALRLERLRELGLGPSASRAYLALLEAGHADARTIGRAARIPLPKVYSTMEVLMEKGFARQVLDTPKRFEPILMNDYLEEQRKMHIAEADRIEREASELSAIFRVARKPSATDRGAFSVLRGRRSVVQKQRALAQAAERSILFLWSDGVTKRLADTRVMLEEAHERGLAIRVIAPGKAADSAAVRDMTRFADVRVNGLATEDGSVAYAIFDDAEALLTHFVPDDGDLEKGHDVGLHVTEAGIVGSLAALLHAHWRQAKPVPKAKRTRARR